MGRKLGPETTRGRFLNEAEYTGLWRAIAGQPKSVRRWLMNTLGIGLNDHTNDASGIIADVSFGAAYGGDIEIVHGDSMTVVFSKAIALAIDRRLDAIVRARQEIDHAVDRFGDDAALLAFERFILKATTPSGGSPPADTKKEGERT